MCDRGLRVFEVKIFEIKKRKNSRGFKEFRNETMIFEGSVNL